MTDQCLVLGGSFFLLLFVEAMTAYYAGQRVKIVTEFTVPTISRYFFESNLTDPSKSEI